MSVRKVCAVFLLHCYVVYSEFAVSSKMNIAEIKVCEEDEENAQYESLSSDTCTCQKIM